MANIINIDEKSLSHIENGYYDSVGLKTLVAISNYFKTNISYFLNENIESNKKPQYEEIKNILYKMNSEDRIFIMDLIRFILINRK